MASKEVQAWAEAREGSLHFTVLEIEADSLAEQMTVTERGFVRDEDDFLGGDDTTDAAWAMDDAKTLNVHYTAYVLCGHGEGRAADAEEMEFIREHRDEVVEIADFAEGGSYTVDNVFYGDDEEDEDE